MGIGARQEELLSYLQGLAPVGEPFEFRRNQVVSDLGITCERSIYNCMHQLTAKGLIKRAYGGGFRKRGAIIVLKRLEDLA